MSIRQKDDEDLVGALCTFIPWIPPPKLSLSTMQLDDEALRRDHMPIKGTYSWSAVRYADGCLLRRHAYAGLPDPQSVHMLRTVATEHCPVHDVVSSASRILPRPADVVKAPVLKSVPWHHAEWKLAYRTLTPESEAPALGTLKRAWLLNRDRGIGELAPRRKPWAERAQAFLKRTRRSASRPPSW